MRLHFQNGPARLRAALGAALLLALAAGCENLPKRGEPRYTTKLLGPDSIESIQPADVAVVEVRNQSGQKEVPTDELLRAFYEGLIERLYSPLDLAYVDRHWAESSFVGERQPDAVLVVAITGWDASRLVSTGKVTAEGEVRLYRGGATGGDSIWGVFLRRELAITSGLESRPAGPQSSFVGRAADAFAREALQHLPERDPTSVHRARG
jgi:hypothetical protein